ncbi:2-methoxy-6-polyprenyl-1 4-benzoquinol methylase mitochondrial [Trichostrongylus colubriformis]|uniref:2-methoxy-6-polyprenyl-1,4-benzoquinol methylase, mitochondrial n=2 Tax=Trichostrongylus colubriformis TaxID=6319 RepID=A0AAN8IMN9_TRICO
MLKSFTRTTIRVLSRGCSNPCSKQLRHASTHFGYEEVDETEKESRVYNVFANVAKKYDLMNDAMSFGIHRLWKDYYVDGLPLTSDSQILDVAGGTGDIAFRLHRKMKTGKVTVVDINQNMLDVGKERAEKDPSLHLDSKLQVDPEKFEWICANAENLPFEDNSFSAYTISFGIRNCTHVEKVVQEAFRVLKPGGLLAVLEFSAVNPLLKPIYDAYSFNVIPVMGQVLAGDYNSYKYLVESIRKFPNQIFFNSSSEIFSSMVAAPPIRLLLAVPRRPLSFTSYRHIRFRSSNPAPSNKEIGRFTAPITSDALYDPGQLFIHKVFAYKGVVVCAFKCRFQEKKSSTSDRVVSQGRYYQVLIDRGDWSHMGFPVDLTSYLMDGTSRGEKLLTLINGMDCVSHNDILPFNSVDREPLDHDLFHRIFDVTDSPEGKEVNITMKTNLFENYMASQRSWLAPRDVYREVTENIEVTVTTFYLGSSMSAGQLRHMWRYVIRLENHSPQNSVILRERSLKVYSLNNMNQAHGHGVVGKQPELNVQTPAFQFSSTVELAHSKGGHMWGRFKMERPNGSTFDVAIPTVVLESFDEKSTGNVEKSVE